MTAKAVSVILSCMNIAVEHHGFDLKHTEFIEEYQTHACLYEHVKTGAKVLTLDNDDNNKVFTISFRTPVENSYGIPHILEHSVLAGSKNYPLKEPFADLIKSSLATFINAYTFPDKTIYPVATANTQDLYNLATVYLDAVFNPLLTDSILLREGWHHEIDPETGKLIYKGVVYNEMWGSYSNPYGEIFDEAASSVFPDTTYQHRSGGNPQVIPDLTPDMIREFHQKYYHPSNSFSFFYGNDHSSKRFELLDKYFSKYERAEIDSTIHTQPLDKIPYEATRKIMNYDDVNKGTTLRAFVFGDSKDTSDVFKRHIEAYYLFGTAGSPVYKALTDAKLGDEFYVGSPNMSSPDFDPLAQKWAVFGLKNVPLDQFTPVQNLIESSIREAAENINIQNLQASLSTTEFNLREFDTGSYPQGLSLIEQILGTWLYDGNPFEALRYENKLNEIKEYLNNPNEFKENLFKYWVDYKHQTRIYLVPDEEMKKNWSEAPKAKLAKVQESLSEEEVNEIKKVQAELQAEQEAPEKPENKNLLPTLQLSDIPTNNQLIGREIFMISDCLALFHEQNTQNIVYLIIKNEIDHINPDFIPYIPLFINTLFESDSKSRSMQDIQFDLGTYTGGFSITTEPGTTLSGERKFFLNINLRCLPEHSVQAANVVNEIIFDTKLNDKKVLSKILTESVSSYKDAIATNGMSFGSMIAKSHLSPVSYLANMLEGVPQYEFLKDLAENLDSKFDEIINVFEELRTTLFVRNNTAVNITTTISSRPEAESAAHLILKKLPKKVTNSSSIFESIKPKAQKSIQGFTSPSEVNFVTVCHRLRRFGYKHTEAMRVINNYLRMDVHWEAIRLVGGAYGTSNRYSFLEDIMTFSSYRDPNISKTIQTYLNTGEKLIKADLSKDDLNKMIIGAVSSFDNHLLPYQKGVASFNWHVYGISDEYRQKKREEILSTTIEDFHKLGKAMIQGAEHSTITVFGSKTNLEEAAKEIENLKINTLL